LNGPDWPGLFDAIAEMHRLMREGRSRNASWAVYPVEWAAVNEIGAVLEEFAAGEENYTIAFARDIINSIPPGSIYFGGTDSGRFLVTALSRSHMRESRFFTITQTLWLIILATCNISVAFMAAKFTCQQRMM
jgi:hypothetical protein